MKKPDNQNKKNNPLKKLWGAVKFSKPGHQIVKELRKEMKSKWIE